MAIFDNIPDIQKGVGFPVGDSFTGETQEDVDRWFGSVSEMSHRSFMNYFDSHGPARKVAESSNKKTVLAALGLCHSWDYTYNNGRRFSSEGFRIASVFIRETNYLPECNVDLSEDLRRMATPEREGGRLNSGREFGRIAWNSVAIYPNVHFNLERLLELAEPRLGIFVNMDRDRLKAGLVLPVMMSWAGRFTELTPHFTSVDFASTPITNDDFGSYFSSKVPLAPDNAHERNID